MDFDTVREALKNLLDYTSDGNLGATVTYQLPTGETVSRAETADDVREYVRENAANIADLLGMSYLYLED